MAKSERDFEQATGRAPKDDDLERVNCDRAGKVGHAQCGWCEQCNAPRFECFAQSHLNALEVREHARLSRLWATGRATAKQIARCMELDRKEQSNV